jgi:putative ABC transport system substrate-binding protein
VVRLATERGLPTVTDYYIPADATVLRPLLTYSPDPKELWRQAISYVDRILRGANPGDLPIQQPTKFELTVNLRMAKAIRLDVPRMILLRADRVIE